MSTSKSMFAKTPSGSPPTLSVHKGLLLWGFAQTSHLYLPWKCLFSAIWCAWQSMG